MDALVALFGRIGRALERLILAVLDNPSGTPLEDLEDAESDVDEIVAVLAGAIGAYVRNEAPKFYDDAVREGGGDPGNLSPEAETAKDLTLEELAEDCLQATQNMGSGAKTEIRRLASQRAENAAASGIAKESRALADEIRGRRIKVIDKAGRRWQPETYSRMVLRTLTGELENAGSIQAARQVGSPGMRISDGGDPPDDGRSEDVCIQANGQYWSLGYASTHLLEHPNCFPAGTVVSGPAARASTARWFDGEIVEVWTERGCFMAVTPHHPIFTTEGWVAAGLLTESSHVLSQVSGEGSKLSIIPDDYQVPALIQDVAGAVGSTGGVSPRVVPTAPEDFHGDGAGSEVCVVRSDSVLRSNGAAKLRKPFTEEDLGWRDCQLFFFSGLRPLALFFKRMLSSSDCLMRRLCIARVGFFRAVCGFGPVCCSVVSPCQTGISHEPLNPGSGDVEFGGKGGGRLSSCITEHELISKSVQPSSTYDPASSLRRFIPEQPSLLKNFFKRWRAKSVFLGGRADALAGAVRANGSLQVPPALADSDSVRDEALPYGVSFDAVSSAESCERFAGVVAPDTVVDIKRRLFSGHVYNLETVEGWYVANGIIVHNCRRAFAAMSPSDDRELDKGDADVDQEE